MMGERMKEVLAPMGVPLEVEMTVENAFVRVDGERQDGLVAMAAGVGLFGLAACVYAASWLLGWIVGGFRGEHSS